MTRRLLRADGPFRALHDAFVSVRVDFEPLRTLPLSPERRSLALDVWGHRVHTEYGSIQVLNRFLAESLAAGDPLDVYAGAIDAIGDELRHTALCAAMVEALGGAPTLPPELEIGQHADFAALPAAGRALATAVSMLAISETISVALIEDLRVRCTHPTVRAVLDATLADEDAHRDYGWDYVRASLGRFDEGGRELARMVARQTLAPHLADVERVLGALPFEGRSLDAHPEPELAELGLMSSARQALVIRATVDTIVWPRLAALEIA